MEDKTPAEGGWSFHAEESQGAAPVSAAAHNQTQEPVSWTASEFIANHKSSGWYLALFAATAALSALMYFVFHDLISVIFIVIVSVLFATLGSKKPRQLPYAVDNRGINIGNRFYPYDEFKSFSVLREGAVGYINLLPLKRFMPELSIYFSLEDEQKIVDILADHLPYEHREESLFDSLMKKLHF